MSVTIRLIRVPGGVAVHIGQGEGLQVVKGLDPAGPGRCGR